MCSKLTDKEWEWHVISPFVYNLIHYIQISQAWPAWFFSSPLIIFRTYLTHIFVLLSFSTGPILGWSSSGNDDLKERWTFNFLLKETTHILSYPLNNGSEKATFVSFSWVQDHVSFFHTAIFPCIINVNVTLSRFL